MWKDLVGAILLQERKIQGKTIQEVADEMGIGTTTVSGMERGLPNVADEKYIMYAKYLGKAEELFALEDENKVREQAIFNDLLHIEDILNAVPNTAQKRLDKIEDLHMFRDASVFATFLRGRIHYEQKNYTKAKDLLEKTLQDVDQCPSLLDSNIPSICFHELGIIAFHKNKYEEAQQLTENAIKVFDKKGKRQHYRPYLYLNLAIYLEILDKIEDACVPLKHLLRMVDKVKSNIAVTIQAYERYANLLLSLGMPRKALKYGREALQIAWNNKQYRRLFSVWSTLGNILTEIGQTEEAKQRYYKALDLVSFVSDNSIIVGDTYFRLGKLLIRTEVYAEAEEMLIHACQYLEKSNEEQDKLNAYIELGKLQSYLGKKQDFENTFNKINKVMENMPEKNITFDMCMIMCEFYINIGNKDKLDHYQGMIWEKWRKGEIKNAN
ncbi:helix-turn-helix transcriptional regulator [Shimazuella kribbensis]|uniref:helix-turn-helix transcriptional regulator n=1 Tax=Shimazuella kribbensis TaxID=139808 RepID=UPI00042522DD|nr:helix-turn-helix transcriptional regulator [Shimazuella kribbensis]